MSFVGAGMDCNAVGSGSNYCFCGFDNAGDADVSGVSEEGDSVDVDAEFSHGMCVSLQFAPWQVR